MSDNQIALVGNPNAGKTSLFNSLTGSRQKVGNWPGVTVERKSGLFTLNNTDIEVIDIPGTYSLISHCDEDSLDVCIACDHILSGDAQLIVNVIDASNLERNLYLTTQLLDMGVPIVIALNMTDIAKRQRLQIDIDRLSQELSCPVVPIQANKAKGLDKLKQVIQQQLASNTQQDNQNKLAAYLPKEILPVLNPLQELARNTHYFTMRYFEGDECVLQRLDETHQQRVKKCEKDMHAKHQEDSDILIADARYSFVHDLTEKVVHAHKPQKHNVTAMIDNVVLNRFLGIPIFLLVMYLMFLFAINIGGVFQDFFDIGSETIFVGGFAHLLHSLHFPSWITAILAAGVGKGINTTVSFIPVIGGMFLFLSLLESSGYMARAAFVVDRLMQALGLPGKAFVPLIVGFGCNVPAVMGARTLESHRDRILTIMMSPFMSCGARLAIFAVFTAAFFPVGGQNIVFALYLIGIVMALFTGLLLRNTLLKGDTSLFVMELPPYHIPHFASVMRQTWIRLKGFLFKAGKVIIPVCILIGTLNSLSIHGELLVHDANQQSLLAWVGQKLTILFAPMGIHQDNWPATVGLITGTLAKEVVVATLNTLYTQIGHLGHLQNVHFDIWQGLSRAVHSIWDNLVALPSALGNPVAASAPEHSVSPGVYGVMYKHFDGQIGAFAYLLFVLLYVPCVSTVAVMTRELNRGWALFSLAWTTFLAYGIAVVFYQLATLSRHPASSLSWTLIMAGAFAAFMFLIKYVGRDKSPQKVAAYDIA